MEYTLHDTNVACSGSESILSIGKIIKNILNFFERGENLLQNGIIRKANCLKSLWKVRNYADKKQRFERGLALMG